MVQNTITFSCPACACQLTVPAHLAGVVGPCPSCGTLISAPMPDAAHEKAVPAYPADVHAAPVPTYAPPVTQSAPRSANTGQPANIRPEPRELPNRNPAEVEPAPERSGHYKPDRSGMLEVEGSPASRHRHRSGGRGLLRFFLASLVIVAGCLVVWAVSQYLMAPKNPPAPAPMESAQPAAAESSPQPAMESPEDASGSEPAVPEVEAANEVGVSGAQEAQRDWEKALDVLREFLAAERLEQRIPLMETRTPAEELANSCLAGILPKPDRMALAFRNQLRMEDATDYYFRLSLVGEGMETKPCMMLVRIRGNQAPKVVADPFLDIYGGRLANYLKTPTKESGNFQVVVNPVDACLDASIPNQDRKLTLKLLPTDITEEHIGLVFCNKLSKIGLKLADNISNLRWGDSIPCTITLSWNTSEDPAHPYVEAIDVNQTLDWNP